MANARADRATKKAARLNIRTSEDEKRLVERAAQVARVSASTFVMEAALRSAEEVLAEQSRFTLPPDGWESFAAMLDRPAREVTALKRAAEKPSPFGG